MRDKIKDNVEILIGVLHTVRSMNFFSRTSILLTKAVTFTEAGYQLDNLSINCDVIPDSVAYGVPAAGHPFRENEKAFTDVCSRGRHYCYSLIPSDIPTVSGSSEMLERA